MRRILSSIKVWLHSLLKWMIKHVTFTDGKLTIDLMDLATSVC